MTHKDFQLIADVLQHADAHTSVGGQDERTVRWVAELMADSLATTNPRFDRARFLKACQTSEVAA